ncbi:MAG: hypothetical protein ABDI19_07585 [Armatimonadota bacterium]
MRWLIVWGISGLVAFGGAQTPPSPDMTQRPEVVIVLYVQHDGSHLMTWTFDRRVPHAAVRERVARYQQLSQQPVSQLEIRDDSLKRNPRPEDLLTVVSFYTAGLVDPKEGTMALTPLARTFADLNRLHIYTLLPKQSHYQGYLHYVSPHLQLWAQPEPQMWRFVLHLTTHEPSLLEIPLKRPPPPKPSPTPSPRSNNRLVWGLVGVVALALLVGAGIYVYVAYLLRRHTETQIVQTETTSTQEVRP